MDTAASHFLEATVQRFEGTHAILQTRLGHRISWPIKQLPDDITAGATVQLYIDAPAHSDQASPAEARRLINALLSAE